MADFALKSSQLELLDKELDLEQRRKKLLELKAAEEKLKHPPAAKAERKLKSWPTVVRYAVSDNEAEAVIQFPSGTSYYVTPGDKLPGGWLIKKVTDKGVYVLRGGKVQRLALSPAKGTAPITSGFPPGGFMPPPPMAGPGTPASNTDN